MTYLGQTFFNISLGGSYPPVLTSYFWSFTNNKIKELLVDFSDVRPHPVYKEGKATDIIECYILAAVDERTATAIEQK